MIEFSCYGVNGMEKQVKLYSQWGRPNLFHRRGHTTSPAANHGGMGMVDKKMIERIVNAQEQVFNFIYDAVAHEDVEIDDETERELEELSIMDTVIGRR